jgi:hypothetical protein
VRNMSIAVVALLIVLFLVGAYFLGTRQAQSSGQRFVPANNSSTGFMFDNKTAQVLLGRGAGSESFSSPRTDLQRPAIGHAPWSFSIHSTNCLTGLICEGIAKITHAVPIDAIGF